MKTTPKQQFLSDLKSEGITKTQYTELCKAIKITKKLLR